MGAIDRRRLAAALSSELATFGAAHPRSRELFERAKAHLHDGVPMSWMSRWAGAFPLFVAGARGARFTDVDGREYVDFCLGDTGAMTGHSPPAALAAIQAQLGRGLTFMLPTEDALVVAAELARRFGLPSWQLASTATDANRFVIRIARHVTGRPRVLVFNWCYHGTVDETFATLGPDGRVGPRPGNVGPPVDPAVTTRVVEFNDLPALERELAHGDVACVLAEPAMTNIGIVLPDPGFHEALRALTRKHGTLLVIDETHTISAGPGGCTRAWGLSPDFVTVGKPLASGLPAAVYGFTAEVAARWRERTSPDLADTGGIGGTLAGNALALAAMRATLTEVLTEEAYGRMIPLAGRFAAGVEGVIAELGLPWIVKRLGARAEYWFRAVAPRNGGEAAAAVDGELDRYMHLAALNRGVLMTPFHNMALMCPATTEADVDLHTRVFRESVAAVLT
ncbi:MAG: aspartate aminotransferase family protein [Anaeromyxobacter sp.]|nr:aspartate aminotransferase family protein [Anaeromyxobacter sp.]MBL0276738.1 aspartate aminotransferase family protein [Anaeromyxobacter sp.]